MAAEAAARPPRHHPPRHYFDHAAHSPLRSGARQAWLEAAELVGNPAGLHGSARRSRAALEDARESIAADLGAHPTEVIFTSGGSEADSMAVLGGVRARAGEGRGRLVISAVEHPAVAGAVDLWPDTVVVGVDAHARVDREELATHLTSATWSAQVGLVSVQTVNNEVGTVQPVDEVAELAHRAGAWFHTDAVQAHLHPGVDFSTSRADLMSLSAHKMGGPVGIGVLLARRTISPTPTTLGGQQERDLRSGTQPTALAAAFAAALRDEAANREHEVSRITALRDQLVRGLAGVQGVRLNGGDLVNPAIVHVTVDGIRADDVLLLLDRAGIDASVGSACRAGVHQPSEVVFAMTGSRSDALSSLRFSMGWTTTAADVGALLAELPGAIATARGGPGHASREEVSTGR